jgi:peptidoglycan/LPS O-acetylase OafA/YrhL
MSNTHDRADEPMDDEQPLNPRDAAALYAETQASATRALDVNTMVLSLLGGFIFLAAYGAIWLSVRHQHPYQGPTLAAIGILYLLVFVVDAVSIAIFRRSTKGIGGRYSEQRRVLTAIGVVGIVGIYVIMGALEHAGVSHRVVYGIYPATVPMVVGGMVGALGASTRRDWTLFTGSLVISAVASGAAFAGPVGAWAVSGLGCSVTLFVCGAFKFVQRRSR